MVAHVNTVSFSGIDISFIDVQVHIANGLPTFTIVGLADKPVGESKERIRSAFHSIGLALPPARITVNLAPADMLKEGTHFDLPIALGILIANDVIPQEEVSQYIIMGELALDGTLGTVSGILPAAMGAKLREMGMICPHHNGAEAKWAGELDVIAPKDILSLINHFTGRQMLRPLDTKLLLEDEESEAMKLDLADVKLQPIALRALEVAAAGGHNMLMIGPPGSGKSMLANRLPSILPPLTPEEMLEISMIESVAGNLKDGRLSRRRPFRSPHHSCSVPAMVGGGKSAKPGELSLAHNGVLFLDELPEFPRNILEALRQPVELGKVTIARVNAHITYPARFQLIGAMNPCKCGFFGDGKRSCSKVPKCAEEYQAKISGPLLDRFDIRVDVPAVKGYATKDETPVVTSAVVAEHVRQARERQSTRYKELGIRINAQLDGEFLEQLVNLTREAKSLLIEVAERFEFSMRGYNRVLRVARTIADLAGSEVVDKSHIAEACGYRMNKLKA